jgi:hypothetical protein
MSDLRTSASSFIAGRNGTARRSSNDSQATQYSDHKVEFHHEFTLGGAAEVYPPGRYAVESAEEIHEQNGHSARVRTSTVLIVPTPSGTRAVQVNARELEAALETDVQRQQLGAPSENPDSGSADKAAPETFQAQPLELQLDRLGIERVPADVFIWQGYRYTNASDAVAAAMRAKTA